MRKINAEVSTFRLFHIHSTRRIIPNDAGTWLPFALHIPESPGSALSTQRPAVLTEGMGGFPPNLQENAMLLPQFRPPFLPHTFQSTIRKSSYPMPYSRADQRAVLEESICGPRSPEDFQQNNLTNSVLFVPCIVDNHSQHSRKCTCFSWDVYNTEYSYMF